MLGLHFFPLVSEICYSVFFCYKVLLKSLMIIWFSFSFKSCALFAYMPNNFFLQRPIIWLDISLICSYNIQAFFFFPQEGFLELWVWFVLFLCIWLSFFRDFKRFCWLFLSSVFKNSSVFKISLPNSFYVSSFLKNCGEYT